MTVAVFIVPEVPRTSGADELRPRVFADLPAWPLGNRVVADGDIRPAGFAEAERFGNNEVRFTTAPADVDLLPANFSEADVFGADNAVVEAPPDGTIRPSTFSEDDVFGADNEVAEAPADGTIRPSVFAEDDVFGANVVSPVAGDDSYGPIDFGPIGGSPV
jgi:hypothetical protein